MYTEDTSKIARTMSDKLAERILIGDIRIPKFDNANFEISKIYWESTLIFAILLSFTNLFSRDI